MSGIFAQWQPRYAERGIATFPVREKRPAVRGYLKIGLPASEQFAIKFPAENAFGLACRSSRITVLDVDRPDERILADAMSEVGPSPFIVRSGSGNFQAWYRHGGETRRVRPDPNRPIDILGDGYVVAPPSQGAKGAYTIIAGCLDDLASLPCMRRPYSKSSAPLLTRNTMMETGRRNETLWRHCMTKARECGGVSDLMEVAMTANSTIFYEPLPDEEVLRIVASAWAKEISGDNWFGRSGRVVVDALEVDNLLKSDPDAFMLLMVLRRHHWGQRTFAIANAMSATMPGGGWTRQRFAAARQRLIDGGAIVLVRPASHYHGPGLYRMNERGKGVEK